MNNPRVERWRLYHDIETKYIPGGEDVVADWLSRGVPDEEFGDEDIDKTAASTMAVTTAKPTVPSRFAPYVRVTKSTNDTCYATRATAACP